MIKTQVFTLREGEWLLLLDGKIIPAIFNSPGAARAAIEVERRRRTKKAVRRG